MALQGLSDVSCDFKGMDKLGRFFLQFCAIDVDMLSCTPETGSCLQGGILYHNVNGCKIFFRITSPASVTSPLGRENEKPKIVNRHPFIHSSTYCWILAPMSCLFHEYCIIKQLFFFSLGVWILLQGELICQKHVCLSVSWGFKQRMSSPGRKLLFFPQRRPLLSIHCTNSPKEKQMRKISEDCKGTKRWATKVIWTSLHICKTRLASSLQGSLKSQDCNNTSKF